MNWRLQLVPEEDADKVDFDILDADQDLAGRPDSRSSGWANSR